MTARIQCREEEGSNHGVSSSSVMETQYILNLVPFLVVYTYLYAFLR